MIKIEDVLAKIPEINEFLTVDEMDESTFALAEKYPDLVSVNKVGESTKKHPIYRLKIGTGSKKALIFGCPHPNEPIGAMMIEHLSRIVCENEDIREALDTEFHFIKCVDPDGLNLNKGWLKGPFSYYNYASNFYRPSSTTQVEWTFPFKYKKYCWDTPLSETQAVMKVIDEVKPDVMFSLHNSSFGGVYWYVNKNNPEVVPHLGKAAERVDLPLNMGEPEVPFCQLYADAVYDLPQSGAMYDYYEENIPGVNPEDVMQGGGCSADYLDNVNKDAFVIICEMPYFYCPEGDDTSLCDDMSRREAILAGHKIQDELKEVSKKLILTLQKYADPTSSCMLALNERIADHPEHRQAQLALMEANPEEYDVPCTKASKFDNLIGTPWYSLLAFGMINTAAKETIAATNDAEVKAIMEEVLKESEAFLTKKCNEIDAQTPCNPIPVKKLVSVQMESALLALGIKE